MGRHFPGKFSAAIVNRRARVYREIDLRNAHKGYRANEGSPRAGHRHKPAGSGGEGPGDEYRTIWSVVRTDAYHRVFVGLVSLRNGHVRDAGTRFETSFE